MRSAPLCSREYDRMVKEDGVTAGFFEQAQAILAQYRQANK